MGQHKSRVRSVAGRQEKQVQNQSVWLMAGIIAVVTLLTYVPTMNAGFIWNDDTFLTNNALIHAQDGLYRFWCTTEPPDYWPLTSTTLWVEWRLWGRNATGYHIVNILLHVFSSILVWRVLKRLNVPGAWVAGLIFAVHPVNVESVAWITERKNVLPMVFYLLTFLAYFRFEDEGRWRWYALALSSFLLGLLAKTSIVMLPVVLLGCAWWRRQKLTLKDVWYSVPFFALSLILGLVTVWYQTYSSIGETVIRTDGFASRLAIAGRAVWFYLYKAVLPVNLSFVYPRWSVDPASPWSWLPLAALAGIFAGLVIYRRPWTRLILFALGYYVIALLPVIGFVNIYFMRYSLVADHWQYFAIISIIALATAGVYWLLRHLAVPQFVLAMTAATVIAMLGILSWQEGKTYKDAETLYRATLAQNPNSSLAHNNLGILLAKQGKLDEAGHHFGRVLEGEPDHTEALKNLGQILAALGKPRDAIRCLEEALRLQPNDAVMQYNLAALLAGQERLDEAKARYEQALRLKPNDADSHTGLAGVLASRGKLDEASEHYRQALRVKPDDVDAHHGFASVLSSQGKLEEAIEHYRQVLRLAPPNRSDLVLARCHLGLALAKQGQHEEAIEHFLYVLRLRTDNPQAREQLGKFQETARQACQQTRIKWANDLDKLASKYAAAGQFDEAATTAQKAVEAAEAGGEMQLAAQLQSRYARFRAAKPGRERQPVSAPAKP